MKHKNEKSVYANMSFESIKAPIRKTNGEPKAKKKDASFDMRAKRSGK